MLRSVPTSPSIHPAIPESRADTFASGPLLRFAGPLIGTHALVIAANGLDLMCSLLRQGCTAATTLLPSERADHEEYDLVLAPGIPLPASIGVLTYQAKRALRPGGRFVVSVPTSPHATDGSTVRLLLGSISTAGFTGVQIRLVRSGVLVRGTLAADLAPTQPSYVIRSHA